MANVTVQELLMKLAEWGHESHDSVCQGISQCRHDRAKQAIVEINNAIAEVEWDHTHLLEHTV